jgi:hypothetical protein
MYNIYKWIWRFLCWWFGAPFQRLPSEFGDPVPVELRLFAAKVEESRHRRQNQLLLSRPIRHEQI